MQELWRSRVLCILAKWPTTVGLMADHNSPPMPKWLHRWFWLWEDLAPGIYRVGAVGTAALATAAVLARLTAVRWWLAAPASLAAWIGLAIAQEHDQRVTLPVDEEFLKELHIHVSPVLAAVGFSFCYSSPANRARGGTESFVYEAQRSNEQVEVIWIRRNRQKQTLGISTSEPFAGEYTDLKEDVAQRFNTLVSPADDAQVVADVLALWLEDKSLRLPLPRSRTNTASFGRRSKWINYGPR